MKRLCFVVILYGEKYQWYIPLYVYSINQAYPNYDVRIYIKEKLSPAVSQVLSELSFLKNYSIIEDLEHDSQYSEFFEHRESDGVRQQVSRCFRWLLYDKTFEQYSAVYVGDIDIFIAKEKFDIYDQHMKHCEFLGLPFSNAVRRWKKNVVWTPRRMLRDVHRYGLVEVLREMTCGRKNIYRLSGLHFVLVKEYYERVGPLLEEYKKELAIVANGRSRKWNKCFLNNEAVLFDLVKDAGFSILTEDYPFINEVQIDPSTEPDFALTYSYRPHHGLHLGLWRNKSTAGDAAQSMKSEAYKEYYRQFCRLRDADSNFRLLLEKESDYVKGIISNMDETMGKLL